MFIIVTETLVKGLLAKKGGHVLLTSDALA